VLRAVYPRLFLLTFAANLLIAPTHGTSNRTPVCSQVQFTSESTGWIIGAWGILKTEDGGATWKRLGTLPAHITIPPPGPPGWEPPSARDPAGKSEEHFGAAQRARAWFSSDTLGFYCTVGNGGLSRTSDGGGSWIDLLPAILSAGAYEDVFDAGYWGCTDISFADPGVSWFLVEHFSSPGEFAEFDVVDFSILVRTLDGGETFDSHPIGLERIHKLSAVDAKTGLLLTREYGTPTSGGRVSRTLDGGVVWEPVGLWPYHWLELRTFDGVAWLFHSAFHEESPPIFRSVDGLDWTRLSVGSWTLLGGTAGLTAANAAHAWVWGWLPNRWDAGPDAQWWDLTVCGTADGGISWECREWSYWTEQLHTVELSFLDSASGWMVLGGQELWAFDVLRTGDGGASWQRIYSGLKDSDAADVSLRPGYADPEME
jgi:hypothetical protein